MAAKLDTKKVSNLAAKIPDGYRQLGKELKQFIENLPEQVKDNKSQTTQNLLD